MEIRVDKEKVFAIPSTDFGVAPTTAGYTLAYSIDGENFTDNEEVTPANETLIVKNGLKDTYYKLKGNTDDNVLVVW